MEGIKIEHLSVCFGTQRGPVRALNDVSITFRENAVTGLIGESGSGKSVLGMSVLRLLPDSARTKGHCWYRGKDIFTLSDREMDRIRGNEIALIPQNPSESLNPVMRIVKQLRETVQIHGKIGRSEAEKRMYNLLDQFGFTEPDQILGRYSFELSGGMNQRIISILGLLNSPEWLIADEPTKGLDAILRRQVYESIRQISRKQTRNMILITHDIELAAKLCDYLAVLYKGSLLEYGTAEQIMEDPRHPYTSGLLASLPKRGMHAIPEPDPCRKDQVNGCPFYPRCSAASSICGQSVPPEYQIPGENRTVRCFLYAGS